MRHRIKTWLIPLIRFLRNLPYYYFSNHPRQISWAITGLCNSKCIFCEVHEQLSSRNDVPTQRVFSLIDEMSDIGIRSLLLVGGEVFVRKDIFDILTYLRTKSMRVQVITNSLLLPTLSDEKIEIIKKCIQEMSFSLDSAVAEQYDAIRGIPGAFNKVITSINLLRNTKVKRCITAVIYSENGEQIPGLITLASELDIDFVHFQVISPATIFENTTVKEGKQRLLLKNEKELDLLNNYILEGLAVAKRYHIKTNLKFLQLFARTYFQNYIAGRNGKDFFLNSVVKNHRCLSIFTNNFIDYDGSFKLCPLLPALGNVTEEHLKDLLGKSKKLKGLFKKGHIPLKFCKDCFCNADINLEFSAFFSPVRNRRILQNLFSRESE